MERPRTVSPWTASSRSGPNGSSPITAITIGSVGEPNSDFGHSIKRQKLYKNTALSAYSLFVWDCVGSGAAPEGTTALARMPMTAILVILRNAILVFQRNHARLHGSFLAEL